MMMTLGGSIGVQAGGCSASRVWSAKDVLRAAAPAGAAAAPAAVVVDGTVELVVAFRLLRGLRHSSTTTPGGRHIHLRPYDRLHSAHDTYLRVRCRACRFVPHWHTVGRAPPCSLHAIRLHSRPEHCPTCTWSPRGRGKYMQREFLRSLLGQVSVENTNSRSRTVQ